MAKNWKNEREKKLKEVLKSLDGLGDGLYHGQVEVKMTPWRTTWEMTSMMMERQEEIISLLEDIKKALQVHAGEANKKTAPPKKKPAPPKKKAAPKSKPRSKVSKKKIDSADYNALRTLCKAAGLKASGKKEVLKKQLYKHYKLR